MNAAIETNEMNLEALRELEGELTPAARGCLAHLLNNALCPLLMEVSSEDGLDRELILDLVRRLTATVKSITGVGC